MRSFVSTLLACILLACPLLCRAGEVDCCHDSCEASGERRDDSPAPPTDTDEGASCICAGATQADEPQADGLTPAIRPNSFAAWLEPLLALPASPDGHHPTREKPPSGLAVFGDGPGVRAYLQNFRF